MCVVVDIIDSLSFALIICDHQAGSKVFYFLRPVLSLYLILKLGLISDRRRFVESIKSVNGTKNKVRVNYLFSQFNSTLLSLLDVNESLRVAAPHHQHRTLMRFKDESQVNKPLRQQQQQVNAF